LCYLFPWFLVKIFPYGLGDSEYCLKRCPEISCKSKQDLLPIGGHILGELLGNTNCSPDLCVSFIIETDFNVAILFISYKPVLEGKVFPTVDDSVMVGNSLLRRNLDGSFQYILSLIRDIYLT